MMLLFQGILSVSNSSKKENTCTLDMLVSNIWNSWSRIDFSGIVKVKWSDGDFQIPDQIQALSCPPAGSRYPHIKLCAPHIVLKYFWNNFVASDAIIWAPYPAFRYPRIKLDTRQYISSTRTVSWNQIHLGLQALHAHGKDVLQYIMDYGSAEQGLRTPWPSQLCYFEQLCVCQGKYILLWWSAASI